MHPTGLLLKGYVYFCLILQYITFFIDIAYLQCFCGERVKPQVFRNGLFRIEKFVCRKLEILVDFLDKIIGASLLIELQD